MDILKLKLIYGPHDPYHRHPQLVTAQFFQQKVPLLKSSG